MDLFLEDHSFGYFLGLIRFGHVVGSDDLNQFFLFIHENTTPFVDVMNGPLNGGKV